MNCPTTNEGTFLRRERAQYPNYWVDTPLITLLSLGIVTKAEIFNWFENLFKTTQ